MRDEWDDTGEWDDDSDEWPDDDAPAMTLPCPECGADVYEDAEQCPHCGHWIEHSTTALQGWPTWFVLLGFLGVVAVIYVLSGLWAWRG